MQIFAMYVAIATGFVCINAQGACPNVQASSSSTGTTSSGTSPVSSSSLPSSSSMVIGLSLYSDDECSDYVGGPILNVNQCVTPGVSFKSMEFMPYNLNVEITLFGEANCAGNSVGSANAGFLGCSTIGNTTLSLYASEI